MRDLIYRSGFLALGGLATGISSDMIGTFATIGAIVLGWVYLETRVEKTVQRELGAHTKIEEEWKRSIESRLTEILAAIPRKKVE